VHDLINREKSSIEKRRTGRQMQSHNQKGFTLIEIAVVLVIIGLLIGGILQGTELIDNSRIKKAGGDFQGIATAYVSYQDRYQRLPGDDGNTAAIQARGGDWATVTGGNNNGALFARRTQTFTGGDENDQFWQHLRAAGYISGDASLVTLASLPRNAFSGLMGVTTEAVQGGLGGIKLCMSQVPGKSASALDLQTDDGSPDSGSLRANVGVTGTNTAPAVAAVGTYTEDNEYTICKQL